MRVIGGSLRGRKLASLRGLAIRPTADRIREAVFNILGTAPVGANVLDLFAGTGAFGIEALSRGARQAVFVEHAEAALDVIRKNITLCRLEDRTRVVPWNILNNLNSLLMFQGSFDLIFLDPPYNRRMIQPTLLHLANTRLSSTDAIVVVEHDPEETVESPQADWALTDQRRYGHTRISFFRARSAGY